MARLRITRLVLAFALGCAAPAPFHLPAARKQPHQLPTLTTAERSFVPTLAAHADARFVGGNRVTVLLNGDETFPALLRAIRGARRSITFEPYFAAEGPITTDVAEALAERCRAGVKGHVLLDAFGASSMPRELVAKMEQAGCEVEWFRPLSIFRFLTPWSLLRYNNRTHRRIVVVDGTVGFTGGYGLAAAWMGDGRQPDRWRDTNAEMEGPVVQQLQAAFAQDWRLTTGRVLGGADYFPPVTHAGDVTAQIVKSSPAEGSSQSYMLFLLAIAAAKRSIHITNPYFVLDDQMSDELVRAVGRGVDVTAIIPGRLEHELGRPDQNLVHHAGRGGLGKLLEAGVRVFQYKAALLHAKTMTVDDALATIGSTNLDARSFALNDEINLTTLDAGTIARLEEVFRDDLRRCDELTYEEWRSRGLKERLYELFALPAKSQL
jgi:cardiolipin synthase